MCLLKFRSRVICLLFSIWVLSVKSCLHAQVQESASVGVKKVCNLKSSTSYFWLNSTELLLLEKDKSRNALNNDAEAFTYNLVTKKRTSLPRLTAVLLNSFVYHGDLKVSPDGRQVVWTDENIGIRTATIDGLHLQKWQGDWHTDEIFWMPDSASWLALRGAWEGEAFKTAVVYSLDKPQSPTKIPVVSKIVRTSREARQVTSDGLLYAWEFREGQKEHKLTVTQYTLLPKLQTKKSYLLTMPAKFWVQDAWVIAKATRFAILLRSQLPQDTHYEIWTLDLASPQNIKKVRVRLPVAQTEFQQEVGISQILPVSDAPRLSFTFDNQLFVTDSLE